METQERENESEENVRVGIVDADVCEGEEGGEKGKEGDTGKGERKRGKRTRSIHLRGCRCGLVGALQSAKAFLRAAVYIRRVRRREETYEDLYM